MGTGGGLKGDATAGGRPPPCCPPLAVCTAGVPPPRLVDDRLTVLFMESCPLGTAAPPTEADANTLIRDGEDADKVLPLGPVGDGALVDRSPAEDPVDGGGALYEAASDAPKYAVGVFAQGARR